MQKWPSYINNIQVAYTYLTDIEHFSFRCLNLQSQVVMIEKWDENLLKLFATLRRQDCQV